MNKEELEVLAAEDVFKLIGKDWMLVTAGNADCYNTMTASWGGFGWLWNRPVAFVFIRPERYTHDFIEANERMTLSFYDEQYRQALQLCGSKSGRDIDKAAEAGLTPVPTESGSMTFAQARLTVECRKIFKTEMTDESILEKSVLERWYSNGEGLHTVYIVEIENVYSNNR